MKAIPATALFRGFLLMVLICAPSLTLHLLAQNVPLHIVNAGSSDYSIIVPVKATTDEGTAAKTLQNYIQQISGVTLPIKSDATPSQGNEVLIGNNNRLHDLKANIHFQQLNNDGFTIKTIGNKLILAGGSGRGNTYAVYTFLEQYLGCRKYTPDFGIVPHSKNIQIAYIKDNTQVPQFNLRSVNFYPVNNEYGTWHKLDELNRNPDWGEWVYEFTRLVPASEFFSSHPEYFALYNGKRVSDQLCMTNEDVFRIVVQRLKDLMAKNPTARYWTVCQNDTWSHCQCDNCRRLDQQHGSAQGSLLTMINRIAEQFPDKIIATHAYTYSLTPPTNNLRPNDNVIIVLSTINCGRTVPIAEDPIQGDFRKDIAGWSQLTQHLYVWDYVTQFSNFLSPYPDLQTLQPNYQFFARNNVSGVFAQASGYVPADFSELKSYMLSYLMWNPDCDIHSIENDFLNHYYGAAAPKIAEYLRLRESQLVASGKNLGIYDKVTDDAKTYLTPELLEKYSQIFDEAEQLVQSDNVSLDHVKISRLPVEYAIIKTSSPGDARRGTSVDRFINDTKKYNISLLSNFNGTYRVADLAKDLHH